MKGFTKILLSEKPARSRMTINIGKTRTDIAYARWGFYKPDTAIWPGLSGLGIDPFRENIVSLAKQLGTRVMALDIPPIDGFKGMDLALGVEILDKCLNEISPGQPTNLIGYSAGGATALKFALEHPKRINKLILVASAGLGHEIDFGLRLTSLPVLGDILARIRIRPTKESMEKSLKRFFHDPDKIPKDLAETLLNQIKEWGFEKWLAWYLRRLRQGVNFKGQKIVLLKQLKDVSEEMPVLLIHGQDDQIIPIPALKWGLKDTTIKAEIIADSGHWPQMEQADKFNQVVAEFLFDR